MGKDYRLHMLTDVHICAAGSYGAVLRESFAAASGVTLTP